MSSDTLSESLRAVADEASLLRFVKLLAADRQAVESLPLTLDGHQGSWANQTIAEFLLAAAAWAEDSEFGVRPGPQPDNPWRVFATLLWAGRGYE
jgi:hypothetical protein